MGYITRLLVELRLQVWQNDGSMCKIEIISRLQGIGVAKPQPAGQTYFFFGLLVKPRAYPIENFFECRDHHPEKAENRTVAATDQT